MSLSTVRCRVLGESEIHTRGVRLTPESELQFGLALYFCAQAGRDVARDDVVRLFWPRHSLEAGRHCMRQAVYRLRVFGVAVRSTAKTAVLDPHYIDADYAPVTADGAPATVFLRLNDVSILPGYSPRFSRAFATWIEDFRGEVGGRIRRGLVRAISELRARGRYADVERLCRFCLRLDPLNEEATLALAESVALAGGKAEAVGLITRYEGEVGRYRPDLVVSPRLLRERISDRLIRRGQAAIELPMVGRDEDVERVLTAFQRLRGSQAVSYVITGGAGVGKTRLALECSRMAQLQGARLLTIGTQPSSRTQALFAVSELVDGLLQMPGAIGCAPAALECLKAMSSPVPIREPVLALDADGEARFAMVRWSILDVLDAILSEGPLVIHVDDAHQLDAQSQAVLQDALRTHAKRPLLLLLTMRPPEPSDRDRFRALLGTSVTHELLPLTDASCGLLVQRFCAVHEETLDDPTRERIIQLSGGNPFFLVELLKHRSELVTDDLPITVQALLEDRLNRLTPTALTVLRAAAVLGLSSNVDRLQRMVERKTTDVLLALSELHTAGLLSSVDGGAHCRHDTIRDAVLERTPTAARVLLHRRAAKTLGREAVKESGVALLWECVDHWRAAGATQNGIRMGLLLARRLLSLGLAKDALDVLEESELKAADVGQKRMALRLQARAATKLRDWRKVRNVVDRWTTSLTSQRRLPPNHNEMELFEHEAHYNASETFGTLPESISECVSSPLASVGHRLAAATLSMIRCDNDGDAAIAKETYDAVVSLRPVSRAQRVAFLTTAAIFHAAFGELSKTLDTLLQLATESHRFSQPVTRALHLRRAGFGLARYGDIDQARELLLECLETFDRLDLSTQSVACIEELGLIAQWNCDYVQAMEWIRRANHLQQKTADGYCSAVEFELSVLLAFDTGNVEFLPSFEMPVDIREALSRSKRGKQSVFSLELARAVISGKQENVHALVPPLLALHSHMKQRGYQDHIVAILSTALVSIDQRATAASLLNEYLTHSRRETRKIPDRLTQLQEEIGGAALPLPSN